MSPAMDYLKHQSRKDLQRMAKERGIKANIRSDEIINKLLAEGFTPPSSAGTTSGDQPENRAPESPRTNSADSKPESAVNNTRRRRAALHVKNDAGAVVHDEDSHKVDKAATQQRASSGKSKKEHTIDLANATPQQARASTMTQYYTPGALSPTEFYDSPTSARVPGSSPAVHSVPPAPPAHLKHTPHKLAKTAATPSKSRRQASGAPNSATEQRSSKTSQSMRSLRDQAAQANTATPLADITAGAQVPASPAQCIADMPSTAAALQRLKQTRSHGRVRSVPAPPPHLKGQVSSSSSPPLDQRSSGAATSAVDKATTHAAALNTASKSKKQTPAQTTQGTPAALSPVPNHLSKRSERSRRTTTSQDPRTILSTRGKRPPSAADHRAAVAAEQAAATAAVAKHTIAVAQAAAMHAAAGYSAQTAALQQQIQQMSSSGRPPVLSPTTAPPTDMARAKPTLHSSSHSSRTPRRPLVRAESAPKSASRRARRPATTSSAETVKGSSEAPLPPPTQHIHGESKPMVRGKHHSQTSPAAVQPPATVIDLTASPSPPQPCTSPSMAASPTLPVQPSAAPSQSGQESAGHASAVSGACAARPQTTQSHDRSVLGARPPTAPISGKHRPASSKDGAMIALPSTSSSSSVSTSDAQRTAGQPSPSRHWDRTPSKPSARRRKSPSEIVHAIQNAGQARTRPTQSATDTSDPRLRGQVPVAPPARLPEEQKQVELDTALRQLQPPRFSSDGDHMSGSDDDDDDMHGELHVQGQGNRYKLARHNSAPGRSMELPGVGNRRGNGRTQAATRGERQPPADVSAFSDGEAPPMMESQLSLQELMQTCPVVRRRRSQRQVVTVEWIQERSRELDGLEESMQVLTLGRSSSGMSADVPLRGGRSVLRTTSSSQMDSGALSKSVDQFLLAERAAAMAAGVIQGGGEGSSRGRDEAARAHGTAGRRAASRSPLPKKPRSVSPAPNRSDRAGPSSRQHSGTASALGTAGVQAVSAVNASRRKGLDAGGLGSSQGPAALSGSKGSGLSPYMASPMAQKAPQKPERKSTVGALRTPSVPPRAAMMACQRKQA